MTGAALSAQPEDREQAGVVAGTRGSIERGIMAAPLVDLRLA